MSEGLIIWGGVNVGTKIMEIMGRRIVRTGPKYGGGRPTLFGKQAKSSESLVNLRGLGKWLFGAKTRLLAVP